MEYVDVGPDRFNALLITEACRADGLEVELLTADDSGVDLWWGVVQHHRLLIHSEDKQAVTRIVERTDPGER
jgi:hypothetical protein